MPNATRVPKLEPLSLIMALSNFDGTDFVLLLFKGSYPSNRKTLLPFYMQ
jgi:hypothetical protein